MKSQPFILPLKVFELLAIAGHPIPIETYGKTKQTWLETFLDLPHGIPSHDTFGRVFGLLDPQELRNSFLGWVRNERKIKIPALRSDRSSPVV